jgi:hypothetical protein
MEKTEEIKEEKRAKRKVEGKKISEGEEKKRDNKEKKRYL